MRVELKGRCVAGRRRAVTSYGEMVALLPLKRGNGHGEIGVLVRAAPQMVAGSSAVEEGEKYSYCI